MAADVEVFRGTSYPFIYNHYVPGTTTHVPLTGCTLYFTVKSEISDNSQSDTSAVILKTVLPDEHTDAAGGISGFRLTDADTYKDPDKYYYSVIIEDADGHAAPPSLYGRFTIKAHPTNRQVING